MIKVTRAGVRVTGQAIAAPVKIIILDAALIISTLITLVALINYLVPHKISNAAKINQRREILAACAQRTRKIIRSLSNLR